MLAARDVYIAFWDIYSSFGSDSVYAISKLNFKLQFGLPESRLMVLTPDLTTG